MKISAGFVRRPLQKETTSILPIPKIFCLPLSSSISQIIVTSHYSFCISNSNEAWIWGNIQEEPRLYSKTSEITENDSAQEIAALFYLPPRQVFFDSATHRITKIACAETNCLMLTDGQRCRFNKAPATIDVLVTKKLRFADISTNDKYCSAVSVEGFIFTWGKCDFLREKHTILIEEESNLRELKYYRSRFTRTESNAKMLFFISQEGTFLYTPSFEDPYFVPEDALREHQVLQNEVITNFACNKGANSIVVLQNKDGNIFLITSDFNMREIKKPINYTFSGFYAFEEGIRAILNKNNSNQTFLYEWQLNENFVQKSPANQTIFQIEPFYAQNFEIVRSSLDGYTFFMSGLPNHEWEKPLMQETSPNNSKQGKYFYHSESKEIRKTQTHQKNLGVISKELELEVCFRQDKAPFESKPSARDAKSMKHFQDQRKLSFGMDNSITLTHPNSSKAPSFSQSRKNHFSYYPKENNELIKYWSMSEDKSELTRLDILQPPPIGELNHNSSVVDDPTNQNNNQQKHVWWRGKNEYKLTESSDMTAGEFYPKKSYREPEINSSEQRSGPNLNQDIELSQLVTPKKKRNHGLIQYIFYSKESETSEHPDPMAIPHEEIQTGPFSLQGVGSSLIVEEQEVNKNKFRSPARSKKANKYGQLLSLKLKSANLRTSLADSKELQAPSNTQRASSSNSSSPWRSKRSNKGSSRDKKRWVEYLRKFSHLHYTKTFNGFEELKRETYQAPANSQNSLRTPKITPFSIKEHTTSKKETQISQSSDSKTRKLSKHLKAISLFLVNHQRKILEEAFRKLKGKAFGEIHSARTSKKLALEGLVRILSNKLASIYTKAFDRLQTVSSIRSEILEIEKDYYRDYCRQQKTMGAFHIAKCIKSYLFRTYYSFLLHLSQAQSEILKQGASIERFVKNLLNVQAGLKNDAFHTMKVVFLTSKANLDDKQKGFEKLQNFFNSQAQNELKKALTKLANLTFRKYVVAAFQKLSRRVSYENKKTAFRKWFQRTRAKASIRVAIDSILKALNANVLRRKRIGFLRIKKRCKGSRLHACQLIWTILLKYTSINLQYGFQNLKGSVSCNSSLIDSSLCMQTPPSSERTIIKRGYQEILFQEDQTISKISDSPIKYDQRLLNQGDHYHRITLTEAKIENLFETVDEILNRRKIECLYAIMNYAYGRFLYHYKRKLEPTYY